MKKKYLVYCVIIIGFVLIFLGIDEGLRLDAGPVKIEASWSNYYENLADLYNESDVIAVVQVKNVENVYIMDNIPMTNFKVEVITPISGVEQSEYLTIVQTGGMYQNRKFEIVDDPLMQINASYLVFGRANDLGTITLLGGPQGRFIYQNGNVTNLFDANVSSRSASGNQDNFLAPELKFVDTNINSVIDKINNISNNK